MILDDAVCEELALRCGVHQQLTDPRQRRQQMGDSYGFVGSYGQLDGKFLLFLHFFGYEEAKQNGWMVFRYSSLAQMDAHLPALQKLIDDDFTFAGCGFPPDPSNS